MRVIVQGRLKQRSYETKEGEKRTVYEVEVDELGPSLRNATAKVNKTTRGGRRVRRRSRRRWRLRRPAGRRPVGDAGSRVRQRRGRRRLGQPRRLQRRASLLTNASQQHLDLHP
jgi:single-stranded DNA-binding protein